ncbi:aminotransferase class V-fold PLP-dependent enzyme [Phaeodactylibacter xiamenensis]|uniref:aminotransferase class V-fold PLP-dependent enzyme n=1 Tax=Phaeodactylibacter xiamenensis TaxID=1524460 RepID=UPI0024A94C40|nr:aminotransferase class V-fold PLP-dependent enzyme [Phaeodactylibacter xiamenensis]
MLNIDQLRADTPGVQHRIHLNNAGASLMPRPVLEAAQQHLQLESEIGGYEAAALVREQSIGFYESVAQLLNAKPDQIAWSGSATQAYNTALSAIPFQAGDTILTTEDDYVSNQIAFLQLVKRHHLQLIRARTLPEGGVDTGQLKALIRQHRPRLVAVTHVPTNSGLVQNIMGIGEVCRANGAYYLVDACQSAGQLPLDVQAIACDFLTATFRKFLRGPRGGGFLYISERVLEAGLEPKFMDLHSAAWTAPDAYRPRESAVRFETWERSYALVLAARAATNYTIELGLTAIAEQVSMLAAHLRQRLSQLEHVRVLDQGQQLCGIVTLSIEGLSARGVIPALNQKGVNASVSGKGGAVIDFEKKGVDWALRFSPHYYNTTAELDRAVEALKQLPTQ